MTQQAEVTFEEAKRCPRCDQPGEEVQTKHLGRKGKAHVIHCKNEKCRWFNTGWVVQTDPDGNIPQREQGDRGQDKDYEARSEDQLAAQKRYWEDVEGRKL